MIRRRHVALTLMILAAGAVALIYAPDLPKAVVDRQYSSDASRFLLTAKGARIHFRDQGPGDGLPVVLIHGSNASLHIWEPWVEQLSDDFRLITLDLPAHGLTGEVPGNDYSLQALNEAVDSLVNYLGVERFVLGGNSMGGGITWRYTLKHPDRVMAMILIDATGLSAWHLDQVAMSSSAPVAYQLLQVAWIRSLARYADPALLIRRGLRVAYHDPALITPARYTRYRDLILRAGTRQATLQRFAQHQTLLQAEHNEPANRQQALLRLSQPTLILWGQQDQLLPADTVSRFQSLLSNTQSIVYSGVGHMPMEEVPVQSAADARQFLLSIDPASAK